MDYEPLVTEVIDAGARFIREFDKYAPVRVAFWVKAVERRHWRLYVASPKITDSNFDLAYGEVVRVMGEQDDPYLDPFCVSVLGTAEPLAVAAIKAQERVRGTIPLRLRDVSLGGTMADEVYIYPTPIAVPVP
jgi:hypothetical protein